ncbi:hypothetical protein BD779DRAFT_155870 [Infundibulicybe gibba]|nr:hypothetical protein BD779DRAFT_155870 [Infundibulicybe gibba]
MDLEPIVGIPTLSNLRIRNAAPIRDRHGVPRGSFIFFQICICPWWCPPANTPEITAYKGCKIFPGRKWHAFSEWIGISIHLYSFACLHSNYFSSGSRDCHAQASTTPALSHISSLLFFVQAEVDARYASSQIFRLIQPCVTFPILPRMPSLIHFIQADTDAGDILSTFLAPPSPHLANSPRGELGDILGLRDVYSI